MSGVCAGVPVLGDYGCYAEESCIDLSLVWMRKSQFSLFFKGAFPGLNYNHSDEDLERGNI